ncbi:MAG: GMP synthase [Halioglobus sp.]|nr:GMP synthase [Halioglobus sp.]
MKLGILKTDAVRPEWVAQFGEYPDMFMRLLGEADPQLEFAVYDVEKGDYPADIDEVDAYLITGSKSSVYEDKAWIHRLLDFVRELHARRKKVVGICFGHQLIAHALGGRTEKSPKGWGVGLHTHTFSARPDWHDGGDEGLRILVTHQDQVSALPEDASVLAGSDFCENAVMQIDGHMLSFQGHPEFLPDYARELLLARRELLGEQTFETGMNSLQTPSESERVARWILNFLAS